MDERNLILIIDDSTVDRKILRNLLEQEYTIVEAIDGMQGLAMITQHQETLALVLLDFMMPRMDGFDVLHHLKEHKLMDVIPVIMITGMDSSEHENSALELGVADFIPKYPFVASVVKKRVGNTVQMYNQRRALETLVGTQTEKLLHINNMMIEAFSSVIEYRSLESGKHIRRICAYTRSMLEHLRTRLIGRDLKQSTIEDIAHSAALHDIGKIVIPDAILLKPGRLTPAEFEIMKTHAVYGCDIINTLQDMEDKQYFRYCYDICRHHHERVDGMGYPDKLRGEEIPLCAQVVAVADVYDALRSKRVYKGAFPHKDAVAMIIKGKCGKFSDRLMECFLSSSSEFESISTLYIDE